MTPDPQLSTRLAQAAAAAVAAERSTRCPAELLLSQWADESAWGKFSPRNNCFGIKQYKGCYGAQLLASTEWFTAIQLNRFLKAVPGRTAVATGKQTGNGAQALREYTTRDWFACFETLNDCFTYRARLFFSGPYLPFAQSFLRDRDWTKPATADPAFDQLLAGICPIYATDPNYAAKIRTIAHQANIAAAIASARSQEPVAATSTSQIDIVAPTPTSVNSSTIHEGAD